MLSKTLADVIKVITDTTASLDAMIEMDWKSIENFSLDTAQQNCIDTIVSAIRQLVTYGPAEQAAILSHLQGKSKSFSAAGMSTIAAQLQQKFWEPDAANTRSTRAGARVAGRAYAHGVPHAHGMPQHMHWEAFVKYLTKKDWEIIMDPRPLLKDLYLLIQNTNSECITGRLCS